LSDPVNFLRPETQGEMLRRWADEARRGRLEGQSGPLDALEDIRRDANVNKARRAELAAEVERGALRISSEQANERADREGALRRVDVAFLLYGLAGRRVGDVAAHYCVGGSEADRFGQWRGDKQAVVGLAVLRGSLVTIGFRRSTRPEWKVAKFLKPEAAWPETGAWSRVTSGALTKPCSARVSAWADAAALDRVTMDWNTATACALAVFGERFGAPEADR
jgi:hypothetical protein